MNTEIITNSPDDFLVKFKDLLVSLSWTILNNCTPDISIEEGQTYEVKVPTGNYLKDKYGLNIIGSDGNPIPEITKLKTTVPNGYYDGRILAAKKGEVFIVMRSMNGLRVLPTQKAEDFTIGETDYNPSTLFLNPKLRGVVMISCTAYTAAPPSGKWYDQPNAICNTAEEVIGVYLPIPLISNKNNISASGNKYEGLERRVDYLVSQKFIINYLTLPDLLCVITLESIYKRYGVKEGYQLDMEHINHNDHCDVGYIKRYNHIAFGSVEKIGRWSGGTIISGTHNSGDTNITKTIYTEAFDPKKYICYRWYEQLDDSGNELFGMSENQSTFCRIDCDGAPLRPIPVLWASAGPNEGTYFTGKILGTPIGTIDYEYPHYPHYKYINSNNPNDYGRNANTLNCITVCLNMFLYVQRDPDSLMNFSQIGYVPNMYAITMRNLAPYSKYELKYKDTGNLHQVFPHTEKRGIYGYDGIAIRQ